MECCGPEVTWDSAELGSNHDTAFLPQGSEGQGRQYRWGPAPSACSLNAALVMSESPQGPPQATPSDGEGSTSRGTVATEAC